MAKRRQASPQIASPTPVRTSGRRRQPSPPERRWPSLRPLLAALGVVAVVGFVGLAFISSATAAAYSCGELLQRAAQDPGTEGVATENQGSTHVAPGTRIRYASCPPTSGSHYNARGAGPLQPGFYGPDDKAGPGGWVHNLEHGYVVVLYRCDEVRCPPESDLEGLPSFAANGPRTRSAAACGYRSKLVVARFDEMATPYAIVAWDRALLLDAFDASRAQAFAARWIEASAPEPNAC